MRHFRRLLLIFMLLGATPWMAEAQDATGPGAAEGGIATSTNSGDNLGIGNQGSHNQGNFNQGDYNQGDHNRGNYNQGSGNSGNHNQGNNNRGNYNQGNNNWGDYNQGNFRRGNGLRTWKSVLMGSVVLFLPMVLIGLLCFVLSRRYREAGKKTF